MLEAILGVQLGIDWGAIDDRLSRCISVSALMGSLLNVRDGGGGISILEPVKLVGICIDEGPRLFKLK